MEFQHLFPDETAFALHLERIQWPEGFELPVLSVMKIPARVQALAYRDFYEGS